MHHLNAFLLLTVFKERVSLHFCRSAPSLNDYLPCWGSDFPHTLWAVSNFFEVKIHVYISSRHLHFHFLKFIYCPTFELAFHMLTSYKACFFSVAWLLCHCFPLSPKFCSCSSSSSSWSSAHSSPSWVGEFNPEEVLPFFCSWQQLLSLMNPSYDWFLLPLIFTIRIGSH